MLDENIAIGTQQMEWTRKLVAKITRYYNTQDKK
jgi:hypothetical protein